MKNKEKAQFYQKIWCQNCESTEDLQINKFNERVICTHCLNMESTEITESEEEE